MMIESHVTTAAIHLITATSKRHATIPNPMPKIIVGHVLFKSEATPS
jgi:hypothetical protein